jgi:hypothetical protein
LALDASGYQDFTYDGMLYRSDTRTPGQVFASGFKSRRANMDLIQHVAGVSEHDSGFVATTKYRGIAASRTGNVYVIDGVTGIDVNDIWSDNPHSREAEVAVPLYIDTSRIEGVYLRDGAWMPNPNYIPPGSLWKSWAS